MNSSALASADGLTAFVLLFAGGLAASVLPCVYPLYPITVSIVRERGREDPFWLHPTLYYLGLVITYLCFGVIAGITGSMLNDVLRLGIVNLSIGVLFFLLALSMVELWHLPFFRPRDLPVGTGRLGTLLLGMSAGLLSSACVGPVVVSILLGLVATTAATSLATTSLAAGKMMVFGLGLGLPFLAIGLFGRVLPRAGNWMRTIQYTLAGVIAWFGYTYVTKGLLVMGLSEPAAAQCVVASLTLIAAAFLLQGTDRAAGERMTRALAALGVVVATLSLARPMLLDEIPAASRVVRGPGPSEGADALVERKNGLIWHLDREAAYAEARQRGVPVFIDFYGHWCSNCKAFEALTGSDPVLQEALSGAVLLKVYDTSPTFADYAQDDRFAAINVGLPFFAITDSAGNLQFTTTDYLAREDMRLFLVP